MFNDKNPVSVSRRRTDNTMAKRQSTKGTNTHLQNIHIQLQLHHRCGFLEFDSGIHTYYHY
jgi:hypothetical protein